MLQRLPLAKALSTLIFIWGIIVMLTVTVTTFHGAVAQRFFLGLVESAVSPGFVLRESHCVGLAFASVSNIALIGSLHHVVHEERAPRSARHLVFRYRSIHHLQWCDQLRDWPHSWIAFAVEVHVCGLHSVLIAIAHCASAQVPCGR